MSWQDRLELARKTYAPFGVGAFVPGVILLVGEQASDPTNAPEQQPFCSDKGSSGWLNKLLETHLIIEHHFFWVNALNNDGSEVDLKKLVGELNPSKVIALGNVAKKKLDKYGVVSEHTYHPQYWKRFKSKLKYPLLDMLHLDEMAANEIFFQIVYKAQKTQLRIDQQKKTWEEKIASAEQMRAVSVTARQSMEDYKEANK